MPNPKIYTDELERFQNKYNMPKYALQSVADTTDKLRGANAFLTGDTTLNTPANQFISWASKTLSVYLETNTALSRSGKYLSSVDLKAFLADFEQLADAKYRAELQEGQVPNRDKYAGANVEDLHAALKTCAQRMNKTLPTLWMERLKNGTMKMDDLHAITKAAYDGMDKAWHKSDVTMAKDLTNVVAGYEAMKQLRDSRKGFFGWLWKLFHRSINAKEEAYFNELSAQVEKLGKDLSVGKISADLTGKTVLGISVKKTQAKEADIQKEVAQSEPKVEKISGVAEILNKKLDALASGEFVQKLASILPKPMLEGTEIQGVDAALYHINLEELNEEYDERIKSGIPEKNAMRHYAIKVFVGAFTGVTQIGYDNVKDTIVAAQRITDAILKEFSPCSLNEEGLKEFTNGYVVKNSAELLEVLKYSVGPYYKTKLEAGFNEAKAEYAVEREQVFNNDVLFAESNVGQSVPVEQSKQINAPSLDK